MDDFNQGFVDGFEAKLPYWWSMFTGHSYKMYIWGYCAGSITRERQG